MLVSELHAAGALAQAAGRAVGYESTGLLFIDRDTATLSVVRTDDGSIVKVLSRSLHSTDAMAVLADMVAAVEAQDAPPQGMFVVGSGVDVASVKSHLHDLVAIPVSAPEESGLALARGAALAAANAPVVRRVHRRPGLLAGSRRHDGGQRLPSASPPPTPRCAPADVPAASPGLTTPTWATTSTSPTPPPSEEGRKPFLLVGSALTSVFVIGVVALVISLAVSIRPTADQRPDPGQSAIIPSAAPPAPRPAPSSRRSPAAPPAARPPRPSRRRCRWCSRPASRTAAARCTSSSACGRTGAAARGVPRLRLPRPAPDIPPPAVVPPPVYVPPRCRGSSPPLWQPPQQ